MDVPPGAGGQTALHVCYLTSPCLPSAHAQPLAICAISDANKAAILAGGGVGIAAQGLSHVDPRSRVAAAKLLWRLSFDPACAAAISASEAAVEGLRKLKEVRSLGRVCGGFHCSAYCRSPALLC